MTPQGNFMVAAPVRDGGIQDLRDLLAQMNHEPGQVNPDNTLVPFARFDRLHVARFAILIDNSLDDRTRLGLGAADLPVYVVFIGDCDGDGNAMLAEIAALAEPGLRAVFDHCEDPPGPDLPGWLRTHSVRPDAQYVNWVGRSVAQIREEQALHAALRGWLMAHPAVAGLPPLELRRRLRHAMHAGGHVPAPLQPLPLAWRVKEAIHLLATLALLAALVPVLLLCAPFYLFILRRREKSDPVFAEPSTDAHLDELTKLEDHCVSNQFTGFGSLKPGRFRRVTLVAALWLLDQAQRHYYTRGRLARVGTIHFARWVFMDNRQRLFFATNYDASMDSYMDDFINKVAYGLNLVFSNGIGWPRTSWLLFGGAGVEQQFKNYLRRHQIPAQVWYKAYPELSVSDLARNTRIREGFELVAMTEPEARQWLALI